MISPFNHPTAFLFAAPIDGVAKLDVPKEWIDTDGTLALSIRAVRSKCKPLASFSLSDPDTTSPFIAPVGGYAEPVRILPIGEIKKAYHGECCLVAPTGYRLYLDDFLPIRSKNDIGRTFCIRFEARCENDRMLQARVIERLGSSEHVDYYNDAALLEPMYSDRWSSYSFTYTVTGEDNTNRAHRKNSILLLASSNGIREEQFCIRNFEVEEIADSASVAPKSVRIVYDLS